MKFSLSWLKSHLDTNADIHQIAKAMTMAGLEVEHVNDASKLLAPFSVAKIIAAAQHLNADRLQVCQVQTIDGIKEIVCGAPNARAGLTTLYAPIGAYVPGLNVTLVEKPVRGVISNGMLCSLSELGLPGDSDGIAELSDDLSVGTKATDIFGADPVIDFEVTPNRPDWLGVHGIARDLAATGLGTFAEKTTPAVAGTFACPITIKVDNSACAFFTGRVIRGVKNGPSPKWLQDRLTSIGLKPISTLVDITNFMAFDRARPLHVYDLCKLSGSVIVAGLAPDGETFEALDGKAYALKPDMCAIMDSSGVIGLGGVMGGASTGVDLDTTDVLLESAWFDPIITAQTLRDTKISSDAGYRFARGVDPQFVVSGLELATQMILDLCGGEASDIAQDGTPPKGRKPVSFDPHYVEQLTAIAISPQANTNILVSLGFSLDPVQTAKGENVFYVPSWRRDIDGAADLVEEVARIHGFNHIPTTPLPNITPKSGGVLTPKQAKARIARRALAAFGYNETLTWSFMRQDWATLFGGGDDALILANPIACELNCMRPSALPNLLEAVGRNDARGFSGARLFEIGPIYQGLDPQDQKTTITVVVGHDKSRHWQAIGQDPLFALKSDLLRLLKEIDVNIDALQMSQGQCSNHWHPGRSMRLSFGPKQIIAEFGELHPNIIKALDLTSGHIGFEIVLDNLPQAKPKATKSRGTKPLSNLMPLMRDFAFLVPEKLHAADLIKAVTSTDKTLISNVKLFDLYLGKGVAEGQKSLGLEVTLQPFDKTLTDAEIEAVCDKVILCALKIGATLRT